MGYNLLVNGVYWGYNPLTNHLLTSWDIQEGGFVCQLDWASEEQTTQDNKYQKKKAFKNTIYGNLRGPPFPHWTVVLPGSVWPCQGLIINHHDPLRTPKIRLNISWEVALGKISMMACAVWRMATMERKKPIFPSFWGEHLKPNLPFTSRPYSNTCLNSWVFRSLYYFVIHLN